MPVAMALQAHTLATRHFRHIGQRKAQQLAVLAQHGHLIAQHRHTNGSFIGRFDIQNLLTGLAIGNHFIFSHHKAIANPRCDQQFAVGLMDKYLDNFIRWLNIQHHTHRVTIAPPAGQLGHIQRIGAPVRNKQHQLIRGHGMQREGTLIAVLIGQLAAILGMALHGAYPALFRADNRHRFFLDHNLHRHGFVFRHLLETCASLAKLGFRAELLADIFYFSRDNRLLLAV